MSSCAVSRSDAQNDQTSSEPTRGVQAHYGVRLLGKMHIQPGRADAQKYTWVLGLLAKVYVLADKLCMEAMVNHLSDWYKGYCAKFLVDGFLLASLTEQGPPNGKLLDFALEQLTWDIRAAGWEAYKANNPSLLEQLMDVSAANCQGVIEKAFKEIITSSSTEP